VFILPYHKNQILLIHINLYFAKYFYIRHKSSPAQPLLINTSFAFINSPAAPKCFMTQRIYGGSWGMLPAEYLIMGRRNLLLRPLILQEEGASIY
jgi:hypothetical protein